MIKNSEESINKNTTSLDTLLSTDGLDTMVRLRTFYEKNSDALDNIGDLEQISSDLTTLSDDFDTHKKYFNTYEKNINNNLTDISVNGLQDLFNRWTILDNSVNVIITNDEEQNNIIGSANTNLPYIS